MTVERVFEVPFLLFFLFCGTDMKWLTIKSLWFWVLVFSFCCCIEGIMDVVDV